MRCVVEEEMGFMVEKKEFMAEKEMELWSRNDGFYGRGDGFLVRRVDGFLLAGLVTGIVNNLEEPQYFACLPPA